MAIFPMLSAVAGFIKVRYLVDKANIDNAVFRAHYRLTTAILFGCCILVTANNLIGKCTNFKTYIILYLLENILSMGERCFIIVIKEAIPFN